MDAITDPSELIGALCGVMPGYIALLATEPERVAAAFSAAADELEKGGTA